MTAAGGMTAGSLMNAETAPAALLEEPEGAGRPALLRRVVRMRRGAVGVGMFVFILLVIVAGRWVAPYGSTVTGAGPLSATPTGAHLLGTDELGRDIFSRVLSGGTFVLLVPLIANIIATLIGGGLGLWAAYVGGRVDQVISRIFDVMLSLPPILMVLVIIAGLGTSTTVILIAVAFFFIPRGGRVLRGAAQAVVSAEYVAAAEARGERSWSIVWRDVLPNMMSPAIADFALRITYGIIFVATLSFLGLGTQPPKADWGLMVSENRTQLDSNPAAVLGPIAAIAILAISLNLIADAISSQLTGRANDDEVTL
jgi:peptide/nickel transport system permease protein